MATWNAVLRALRKEHTLEVNRPGEVGVTARVGERAQRVIIRRFEAWGLVMIELRSAFGDVGDYPAESLLADNLQLPIGAVAAHDGYLVLVHKVFLADMKADGVLRLVEFIARSADLLEERRGGDRF